MLVGKACNFSKFKQDNNLDNLDENFITMLNQYDIVTYTDGFNMEQGTVSVFEVNYQNTNIYLNAIRLHNQKSIYQTEINDI